MYSDVLKTIFMRILKFKNFSEKYNSLSKRRKKYIYIRIFFITFYLWHHKKEV